MGYRGRVDGRSVERGKPFAVDLLKDHPNYKMPVPRKGESQIAFAIRCAANLLSPPQNPGESYEVECVDAARQIRSLTKECKRAYGKGVR